MFLLTFVAILPVLAMSTKKHPKPANDAMGYDDEVIKFVDELITKSKPQSDLDPLVCKDNWLVPAKMSLMFGKVDFTKIRIEGFSQLTHNKNLKEENLIMKVQTLEISGHFETTSSWIGLLNKQHGTFYMHVEDVKITYNVDPIMMDVGCVGVMLENLQITIRNVKPTFTPELHWSVPSLVGSKLNDINTFYENIHSNLPEYLKRHVDTEIGYKVATSSSTALATQAALNYEPLVKGPSSKGAIPPIKTH